jgi:hypothetical protein
MAFEAIMAEVDQLNLASDRIVRISGTPFPGVRSTHIHRRKCSHYCDGIGSAGGDRAAGQGWSHFHFFKETHLILRILCAHRSETCRLFQTAIYFTRLR